MIWPAVICTFIGAAIGTLAVQTIDAAILERLLPFLLMAFACYFYFSPRVSDAESSRRLTPMLFALLVGGGVGFMTASSGRAQVRFCHRFRGAGGLWHGARHRPYQAAQLHLEYCLLLFFALGGKVVWSVGFCMALGQFIGARFGSKMVLKKG